MKKIVRPFVKWAGGKASLIPQITKYYPEALKTGCINKYVEPFVGGGAILLDVLQKYEIKKAYAYDTNQDLVNAYNVIKTNVDDLIKKLKKYEDEYIGLDMESRKEYYYDVRSEYNSSEIKTGKLSVKRASEFIFLNRTCFNGLYRVNQSGDFNVPMGKYKNPTICDEENLRSLSELLQNVEIIYGDYQDTLELVDDNTFVYFDPPYRPLNITSGFTSYTKEDFNDEDQKQLASYYKKLDSMDAKLMLSNSNPKNVNEEDTFFDDIYQGFNINELQANRMINSNATKRGKISELLILNY
mgnify:FL=1